MNKKIRTLYIAAFIIIMCLPHVFFALLKNHVDTNNYENRPFNEAPTIGKTSYMSFSDDFEKFYNDHIPFRNQLIALNNYLGYFLFKSTTSEQVLIGKDDWLFIKDVNQGNEIANYTGQGLLDEELMNTLVTNVLANKEFIESKGMEFVIFVSPNKSRVYSEYMPDYLGAPASEYQLKQMMDYFKANTDVTIIYDYDEIMDTKEKLLSSNIPVYHKVDTHWNPVGGYAGAKSLLKYFGKEMPDISELTITPIANTEADLADMLHMKGYFINSEDNYDVTGYEQNGVIKEIDDNSGNEVISYVSNADDKRIVYICRDSFAKNMGEYVGTQFARVYMRHHNTYTLDDLEAVNPDIFVFETAERGAFNALSTFDARRVVE